jgi:hypothetical protein
VKIIKNERYADNVVAIECEPKHTRNVQEILDRLQNHIEPQVFTQKAVYDGKAIPFASHQLRLSGGAAGQFTVTMSDRPPGAVAQRGLYNVKSTEVSDSPHSFHFRINLEGSENSCLHPSAQRSEQAPLTAVEKAKSEKIPQRRDLLLISHRHIPMVRRGECELKHCVGRYLALEQN